LIETIRSAAVGDCKLSSRVAERLLFEMQHQSKSLVNELTAREIEVLKEIARGYSNRKIASDLSVSERTIKTHVSNILSKLYLEDRTQAAIYALQHHLVPLNETFSKQ
jgi:NarL family two-component system response regulator LiaR